MAARARPRPTPPPAAAPRPIADAGPPTWLLAAVVFLVLFAVYTVNFRLRGAGDSIPTRLIPFSLLREGDLDLNEFTWELTERGTLPYYVHGHDGQIHAVSTVATGIVVTPLYLLPAWWMARHDVGYDDVRARVVAVAMERVAAATLTALSAVLLLIALRRLAGWRWAMALTLLYGLGTSAWSISSQALWPHALGQLTLAALCLLLLAPAPSRAALVVAGLVAAVSVANRPQSVTLAAVACAFVAVQQGRRVLYFAAAPLLAGLVLAAYNQRIFSTALGGYGSLSHFDGSLVEGVTGLLVSPNRGLLVFTPIMVFALWGAWRVWRVPAPPWLRWLGVALLAHILVHGLFREWWAGYTYGPRYFCDVLPALTLFLVYGLVPYCRLRAVAVLAAALAVYGVGVQAIGAWAADDDWNREPVPLERDPGRVWDWGDLQIVRSAGNRLQPFELYRVMVDAFRDPAAAQLAALAPAQLAGTVRIVDLPAVLPPAATREVAVRIRNAGAAAWPAFNGDGVISARHLVFLLVRWYAGGRPLAEGGDVVALPENVAPGESVEVRWPLTTPSRPGAYELELRVTQAVDGRRGVVGPDALRWPVRLDPALR